MYKDLHNTDKFFQKAYQQFENEPSPEVWEKINAGLNKKESVSGKKGVAFWKKTAILVLLLLCGIALFDLFFQPEISENIKQDIASKNTVNTDLIPAQNEVAGKGVVSEIKPSNQVNFPLNSIYTSTEKQLDGNLKISILPALAMSEKADETTFSEQEDKQRQKFYPEFITEKNKGNITAEDLFRKSSLFQPFSLDKYENKKPDPSDYKKKSPHSNWTFTPFVAYNRVNYKLDSDIPSTVTNIRHREVHEPSFSGGILANKQLSNHWALQTGLVYSATQIGIHPQKMYALQLPGGEVAYKFITSSGYAFIKSGFIQRPLVGDSLTTSDAKHLLSHISVPLAVQYKIRKKKLTVTPSAGIEANLITSAKVEVGLDFASNREIVTVNKLNGIKSFYLSAVAGLEASYKINNNLSVNIQPVFHYALTPITKDNVVETYPYSTGIRAGVTIQF